MDGVEIAAVITALTALILGILGLLGKSINYVVTKILDAYKQQVVATETAKNAEIAAKSEQITRHQSEISYLRQENIDLRSHLNGGQR